MNIEKHGRSFLVSHGTSSKEKEYTPKMLPANNKKVTKAETKKLIAGLHKSGTRTIKELALIYKLSEKEVENIISK